VILGIVTVKIAGSPGAGIGVGGLL
jgi:hypothetical protein